MSASKTLSTRHRHAVLCAAVASTVLGLGMPAVSAPGATAGNEQACVFTHPMRDIAALSDLPQPVRDALGLIADKDQPFNSTDVMVFGRPSRRFIAAGQSGDLYLVWYLQGGIFLSTQVAVYRLESDRAAAKLVGRGSPSRACEMANDLQDST